MDSLAWRVTARAGAVLATGALAVFASGILIPLLFGVLITLLLVPATNRIESLGIPRALASAVLLLGFVGVVGVTVYHLREPATSWLDRAPSNLSEARRRLSSVMEPVEKVAEAAREVDEMAAATSGNGDDGAGPGPERVEVDGEPSPSERLFQGLGRVLTGAAVTTVLVFFLLAGRGSLFQKFLRLFGSGQARAGAAGALTEVRFLLSKYLSTMTLVNTGLGVGVGLATWALGYPTPVLWGLLAGILNFVPYLGSLTGIVTVLFVGLVMDGGGAGAALAGAGAYLVLTSVEGMVVTPTLMGRRLRLNPVAVLLGIMVLGSLWGIAGVFLAVPVLVLVKVSAEFHPRGRMVSMLLGR